MAILNISPHRLRSRLRSKSSSNLFRDYIETNNGKINTIINLADDISRSMGVGAVRIAQIYGTQYLGVEVPNEQREAVTIKELLSDENFKNTSC